MKAMNNKNQRSMCHERANVCMDEQMGMESLQVDTKQQEATSKRNVVNISF
jgi:hypothetical protein